MRAFGKTGENLTIVGQAGGRFPLCTFDEAKAVTQRAIDLGINYFDTARSYWDGLQKRFTARCCHVPQEDLPHHEINARSKP